MLLVSSIAEFYAFPFATNPNLIFDRTCPMPNCNMASQQSLRHALVDDPRVFMECALVNGRWRATAVLCPCETYFWFPSQRCESPWNVPQMCLGTSLPPPPPRPCGPTPPTTTAWPTTTSWPIGCPTCPPTVPTLPTPQPRP